MIVVRMVFPLPHMKPMLILAVSARKGRRADSR